MPQLIPQEYIQPTLAQPYVEQDNPYLNLVKVGGGLTDYVAPPAAPAVGSAYAFAAPSYTPPAPAFTLTAPEIQAIQSGLSPISPQIASINVQTGEVYTQEQFTQVIVEWTTNKRTVTSSDMSFLEPDEYVISTRIIEPARFK